MLAQALRLPVVVHAGTSVMGTTEADELVDIGVLCTRYPTLLLILGTSPPPSLHLPTHNNFQPTQVIQQLSQPSN